MRRISLQFFGSEVQRLWNGFSGKSALVTGGARRLGREIALLLHEPALM